MEPVRQHNNAFQITGLTVRTTNHGESHPETALIGALWDQFFGEQLREHTPERTADPRNFGVYSAYASDADGAFDVTAGVAVAHAGAAVDVQASDYLVWTGSGEMPHAVVSLWQAAWAYFSAHPEIRRRYVSDFEAYTAPPKSRSALAWSNSMKNAWHATDCAAAGGRRHRV